MSRAGNEAYGAACKAAWEMVRACEESIRERIRSGEVTDEDSLSDAIHEEADNACIYTSDCWVLAYGLKEAELIDGLDAGGGIDAAITQQAYVNLKLALEEIDFSDAFAVAEDSKKEDPNDHASHEDFYVLGCAECMKEQRSATESEGVES